MMHIAFVAAALVLGADSPEYKLTVGPVEEDLAWAVLAADVPRIPEGKVPVLRAADGSSITAFVPYQHGGRIVWTVAEIKKGQSIAWNLAYAEKGPAGPGIEIKKLADKAIEVDAGGKLFTKLVPGEHKPYLWPILLDGVHLTRHYPMESFAGEDKDHVHQKSFWFDHGSVNGVDFWGEDGKKSGKIVHREIESGSLGGAAGFIDARGDWTAPDGKKLIEEHSNYTFFDLGPGGRFIELSIDLTAAEGPVTLGDTKEGTFGIRLAESMKETRGGKIVNSRGGVGEKACWGKPAEWVDYYGKIDGKTYGVAIFDGPDSFRHPTTWHVRGYGLFAANPFGLRDFTGDKMKDGSAKIGENDLMHFRYRVFFHPGTTEEAKVAAAYRAFAEPPRVKVEKVK